MRLLVISSEFPPGPGGIATHAYQLAVHLRLRGWDVLVMSPQDYAPLEEIRAFNGRQPFDIVRFRRLPFAPAKAVQRFLLFRKQLRAFRPDIVLATGQRAVWIAAAVLRLSETPWVAVGHGSEFGKTQLWERDWVIRSYGEADAVVAVSEYTLGVLRSYGVRPFADTVIPNGADDTTFRRLPENERVEYRRTNGYDGDTLLLTVGNVTERKGQENVIRAMPRILTSIPSARYLMAGLPTERPRLERLAESLGVASRISFLGRVGASEVVQLMNAADLFVMTSKRTADGDCEGFGIAVVEAALCGRTAVVSGDSGLAEAVVHGCTGLCVPSGDEAATADAVVRLLGDAETRRTFEAASEERARKELTWAQCAARHERLFEEILKRRSDAVRGGLIGTGAGAA